MTKNSIPEEYKDFSEQVKNQVATSRYSAIKAVNNELLHLYHYLGSQILQTQHAHGWGAKVIQNLSNDLSMAFPTIQGFSLANLHNMRRFAELYPDITILQHAAGRLPWYHHVLLMERVKDSEERLFYIEHAVKYGWSRSVMIHQLGLGLYKRGGKLKENAPSPVTELTTQILEDPYVLDFLNTKKEADERESSKKFKPKKR